MYIETQPKVDTYYLVFWIVEDDRTASYSRKVVTIWDALADAGGFYEVISLMALTLIFHYQSFSHIA